MIRAPIQREGTGLIDHPFEPIGKRGERDDEKENEPHDRAFPALILVMAKPREGGGYQRGGGLVRLAPPA